MSLPKWMEPLVKYERWLADNVEDFRKFQDEYAVASKNQFNAKTQKEADKWQDIRLDYALKMTQIREAMRETYKQEEASKQMSELEREKIFLALIEDFSEVIHKHLPKFDNNIEEETWKMLEVFTEEITAQLL